MMRAQAALTRSEIRLAALLNSLNVRKCYRTILRETTAGFHSLSGSLFDFGATQDFDQLYVLKAHWPFSARQ